MRTLTLLAADLRALRPFCSTETHRGAIVGICIERNGVAVATDGHTLLAAAPVTEHNAHLEFTRPHRDVVLVFDKPIPSWAEWATMEIADEAPANETPCLVRFFNGRKDAIGSCREIPGPFPSWRHVIPRDEQLSASAPLPLVNAALLERFAFGTGRVHIVAQNHPSRALAVFPTEPRYFGLLMPMYDNDRVLGKAPPIPEFVRYAHEPATEVAA